MTTNRPGLLQPGLFYALNYIYFVSGKSTDGDNADGIIGYSAIVSYCACFLSKTFQDRDSVGFVSAVVYQGCCGFYSTFLGVRRGIFNFR
jgi:hypothetical protein